MTIEEINNFSCESYEIKVEGEMHQYEDGGKRCIKNKGRCDLLCDGVIEKLLIKIKNFDFDKIVTKKLLILSIYYDAFNNRFAEAIFLLTIYNEHIQDSMDTEIQLSCDEFLLLLPKLLQKLSIHFQKGAEIYGEHNCEQLPLWSLIDSGRRHMLQFLDRQTDEDHFISAIWNFWVAIYVQNKQS